MGWQSHAAVLKCLCANEPFNLEWSGPLVHEHMTFADEMNYNLFPCVLYVVVAGTNHVKAERY